MAKTNAVAPAQPTISEDGIDTVEYSRSSIVGSFQTTVGKHIKDKRDKRDNTHLIQLAAEQLIVSLSTTTVRSTA